MSPSCSNPDEGGVELRSGVTQNSINPNPLMLRSRLTRLTKWLAILIGITIFSFTCLLLTGASTFSRDQNLIVASQSLQLTPSELSLLSLSIPQSSLQLPQISTSYYRTDSQLDVVISYHSESLAVLKATITSILSFLKDSNPRFIIYNKNSLIDSKKLLQETDVDAVISLENVGREGQTYLHHILSNYDSGSLADRTLFMQPHIEWVPGGIEKEMFLWRKFLIGLLCFPFVLVQSTLCQRPIFEG